MTYGYGKFYAISGLDGIWKIVELEIVPRNNFISLVRFQRVGDGNKRVVRNIEEKDLRLSVRETRGENVRA